MRSRVAAQTLTRNNFSKVYNLIGGIKAWKKAVAFGPEETGLHLFPTELGVEEAVTVGFGLEMGLRDFYLSMQSKVTLVSTKALFAKLAEIESRHQERLVELYREYTGTASTVAEFSANIAEPAMEGGLTTDQYLQLYEINLESEIEVLGLAVAIEAQALDLYLRAAGRSQKAETRQVLLQIGEEERNHIKMLSTYIDQMQELP